MFRLKIMKSVWKSLNESWSILKLKDCKQRCLRRSAETWYLKKPSKNRKEKLRKMERMGNGSIKRAVISSVRFGAPVICPSYISSKHANDYTLYNGQLRSVLVVSQILVQLGEGRIHKRCKYEPVNWSYPFFRSHYLPCADVPICFVRTL